MAPKYRLTYFDFCALGEFIRYLLSYGNIDFEDNRIDPKEWPKLKSSYPLGQLPLLEAEAQGERRALHQSLAIGRLLAREVGLAPADAWDAARADAAVDSLNDLRVHFVAGAFETDEAVKAQLKEKFEKKILPLYLPRLEAQVQENNGYFVNGKLSWADIYLAAYNHTYTHFFKDMFSPYPGLQGVIDKVHAIPEIKAWVAKRPKTDF